MVDMKVFLAVDENGVKLATRAAFWHAATTEMMAVPTVEIWAIMRAHGWSAKETQAADNARRNVIQRIENNAKKKRDHEAAIKNIDMKVFNVFLAVDGNGDKLATKAAFWHAATDEMKAVPTAEIWKVMRAHGWTEKEIQLAKMARRKVIQSIECNAKKKRDHEAAIKNIDMKVYLAVDDNGLKLATKAAFWHAATDEMKAVEPKIIWAYMRAHGWVRKEIGAAHKVMEQVIQSIECNAKKKRDYEAAIKNIDMKVYLAVDGNGLKLATKAAFWHAATDEMKAVEPKIIWAYLRAHGWTAKEIHLAYKARVQVTPAGRAKKNASSRKLHRKIRSTPAGQLMHNASRTTRYALKTFGMEKTERTNRYLKCTDKEFHEWCSKFMKPNIRIGVYDCLTHDSDPVYQIDHGMPVAIVAKNQNIEGLVDFCISYKNQRPIDARFNQLKKDAIILELIHPDCHALSYIHELNGVDRVFATIDEFLAYKGVSRSEFPLL